jgi:phospholipase C
MKRLAVLLAALILAWLPTLPAVAVEPNSGATTTPIKHVVWLMQDNHSFDNYFGTYPGADGIPPGVCQRLSLNRASTRGCVQPFPLGDTPAEDLSQGLGIQRRQFNNGKMDGFVAAYRRSGQDGTSVMGYYNGNDIPFHWNVANQYVLFDKFFASTAVGSRESYLYWLSGKAPAGPAPLKNNAGYDALPTVFDRLAEQKISAKFYVENLGAATLGSGTGAARSSQLIKVPLLSMKRFRDGGALAGQVVDLSQYYVDLRNGSLPAVSYIVTSGSSENPPASPAAGSRTLRKLSSELMKSRYWSSSAFMWTYDSWGGWYDHVPPPKVDARGYGFRVPALLLSPYAKRGVVDHTVLDYTSMLKFIEDNWRLAPLSTRDAGSAGLTTAFDFGAPPRAPDLLPLGWGATDGPGDDLHPAPVIYSIYGGAAAFAALVVVMAVFVKRPLLTFLPDRAANLLSGAGARLTHTVHGVLGDAWPARQTDAPPGATAPSPAVELTWFASGRRRRAARTVPSVVIDGGQTWFKWYQMTCSAHTGSDGAAGDWQWIVPVETSGRRRRAAGTVPSVVIEGVQTWADWSLAQRSATAPGDHHDQ